MLTASRPCTSLALVLASLLSACPTPYGDADSDAGTTGTPHGSTSEPAPTATTEVLPATTTTPGPGVCGDGIVDLSEQCDLGPANADDADCTAACNYNVCGDGLLNPAAEACDDGPANADDAACTAGCHHAICGDQLLLAGVEVCDDGVNDGAHGGCAEDCSARAPACGDGVTDLEHEDCDGGPACLGTCAFARSCLDYKASDPAATSGLYTIHREGLPDPIDVWCDMDVDGGGYTFLKIDVDDDINSWPYPASQAETVCADFGMQLFIPRSQAHLQAAYTVATTDALLPLGGGSVASGADYLRILGIVPVAAGISCADQAINSVDCPEWQASDAQVYWVSAAAIGLGEPDPDGTCSACSMAYTWNPDGSVKKYITIPDVGGQSFRFMCDTGDKLP